METFGDVWRRLETFRYVTHQKEIECDRKGDRMAEIKWTVEGRRFRNAEEYQSALRDKKLIDTITGSLDLDDPKDIERLYVELKNGKYTFESIVGRQFDDNIYELYQRIKREEREREEEKAARKERRKQTGPVRIRRRAGRGWRISTRICRDRSWQSSRRRNKNAKC